MKPILENWPISPREMRNILKAFSPVEATVLHMDEVDRGAGAGITGPHEKCLWTRAGHRITMTWMPGGGYMGSLSLDPDPAYQAGRFPEDS